MRVISTIRSVVRRDETRVGVEEGLKRFVEDPYISPVGLRFLHA